MNPRPAAAATAPGFLFVTCQIGAEGALKAELACSHPAVHLAFSRPGFLTFKLPLGHDWEAAPPAWVFARSRGFSLGKVSGQSAAELAAGAWQLAGRDGWQALHVWQRDMSPPGNRGLEPGGTPAALAAAEALQRALAGAAPLKLGTAAPGDWVLDCVLVDADQWWIGYHEARDTASCWPGGAPPLTLPPQAISRAYLKMQEALAWSQLPVRAGQHCAEIGCAPGGASQALLEHGLTVLGIDPADVDPRLAAEPGFTHLKMRGADVRRRMFRNVRWLTADINIAPQYTLDTVGAIVAHPAVKVEGMLLTLKLLDWQLADELPGYLEQVRQWGFTDARARQLAFNRQEVCVAATRPPQRASRPRKTAQRQLPNRLTSRRRRLD